jgi:hypothetical protein
MKRGLSRVVVTCWDTRDSSPILRHIGIFLDPDCKFEPQSRFIDKPRTIRLDVLEESQVFELFDFFRNY